MLFACVTVDYFSREFEAVSVEEMELAEQYMSEISSETSL